MIRLNNKTALITGGSRGIGAAIAKRYAKEGAQVALTYNSSADKANEVVAEIEKAGGKAKAIKFDASNPQNAEACLKEALDYLGHIDILINNAGVGKSGKIGTSDASLEEFDRILNVNVRSLYALTHLTVPHLKSGARIINMSSVMGERAIFPNAGMYISSKFTVTGLTKSWAHDLGEDGILVNAIMPGPIDTDMNPAQNDANQANNTVLKRYGNVDDIANMAVFLGEDASNYITGSCFNVDGGTNA